MSIVLRYVQNCGCVRSAMRNKTGCARVQLLAHMNAHSSVRTSARSASRSSSHSVSSCCVHGMKDLQVNEYEDQRLEMQIIRTRLFALLRHMRAATSQTPTAAVRGLASSSSSSLACMRSRSSLRSCTTSACSCWRWGTRVQSVSGR